MTDQWKDSERAKEPQKDSETQAPAHAGAITADIALKEYPKDCADQQRDEKVRDQRACRGREFRQPFKQRQISTGIFPAAECQSTDGSGKSTSHDGASPAEARLSRSGAEASKDSENDANRHAQANQISNELRKSLLGIAQHGRGRGVAQQEQINSRGHHKPQKQS